jgi:hypothetical protein
MGFAREREVLVLFLKPPPLLPALKSSSTWSMNAVPTSELPFALHKKKKTVVLIQFDVLASGFCLFSSNPISLSLFGF